MKDKIKVLVKHPHEHPELQEIENSLEALQEIVEEIVGGYIETATFNDIVVICNEEGRIQALDPNVAGFVGTIIFVGVDGTDFADVPEDRIERLMMLL